MRVGFTGTRLGMTDEQRMQVRSILETLGASEFHHGDCIGADYEAADIAADLGIPLVVHPPIDETHRGGSPHQALFFPQKKHFERNRDIVRLTEVLIATPQNDLVINRESRGGTAYTVCFARQQHKPVYVVRPGGKVERERNERV